MRRALVAAAAAALLVPAAANARTFLVHPGADLTRVQLETRRTRGPDTVLFTPGTYVLARPLVLASPDSNVTWRALPGAPVVLSGGERVTGWTEAAAGRWIAPVASLRTRQLFVDGVRATRAAGTLPGLRMTATGYTTTDTRVATWRNPRDVELVWNVLWKQFRCKLARIDGTSLVVAQPCFANAQLQDVAKVGLPTRVENASELLDAPGEWYLDRSARTLTYLPREGEDMTKADVVAPRLAALLVARGVHGVAFDGITFADTTWLGPDGADGLAPFVDNFAFHGAQPGWVGQYDRLAKMPAAVTFSASRDVTISGCSFVRLGAAALSLDRATTDSRIVDSDFADDSGTAIQLGDVFDHGAPQLTRGIDVERNRIRDVAVDYQGGDGIWAGFVADTTIAHNDLSDLPYTGISVGWGWGHYDDPPSGAGNNRIEANLVRHVMTVLGDGGGIYLNGAQPGTVVTRNVVVDNVNWGGALYLDDGSRYETVSDNVVFTTHRWPYMFKAQDVTIRDNWWDYESSWGWAFFLGGAVAGNHLATNLSELPQDVLGSAGIPR